MLVKPIVEDSVEGECYYAKLMAAKLMYIILNNEEAQTQIAVSLANAP